MSESGLVLVLLVGFLLLDYRFCPMKKRNQVISNIKIDEIYLEKDTIID